MIKTPIPGTLQIELGEMRSHLLAWLARQRGVFPVKNTPVLRFPDRVYQSERDMLYLNNSTEICLFCRLLKVPETVMSDYAIIRRVAVAAFVDHTEGRPRFLGKFDLLYGVLDELIRLEELLVVFVIVEHGKLVDVTLVSKGNHSAYSIESLQQSDLDGRRDGLKQAITGLDGLVRPMLWGDARDIKITACKMIPRT
jgi:hypothetical protein